VNGRFEQRVAEARVLLGVRPGACGTEVKHAFREAVKRAHPDLGLVDGAWLQARREARDLLLAIAEPDRRRRRRAGARSAPPLADVLPLRRATWGLGEAAEPQVDVRL
jgi:hypothetical protein